MYCTYVFHLDTNGNIDNLEYTEASYILFISFSHVGVFMLTHDKYYTLFVMDNRVFYYSLETIIGVLYILSVYLFNILFYDLPYEMIESNIIYAWLYIILRRLWAIWGLKEGNINPIIKWIIIFIMLNMKLCNSIFWLPETNNKTMEDIKNSAKFTIKYVFG